MKLDDSFILTIICPFWFRPDVETMELDIRELHRMLHDLALLGYQALAQWYDHNTSQNSLIMEFGKAEMEEPGLILILLAFQ